MSELYLICIDDQPEVLNALERDLGAFESFLNIEVCDSGEEALELMEEIDAEGKFLAVVISDQVMPGKSGVDLLTEIQEDARFSETRKILLTGLASHQDTIDAINKGGLDFYVQKPWTKENISKVIKSALTQFILEKGIDYEKYIHILDKEILYKNLHRGA